MIVGRYRLLDLVASTEDARIYQAILEGSDGFERRVALKLYSGPADDDRIERFLREARIAAQLHHAAIAAVIDFGWHDYAPYQVLEWVPGANLREIVDAGGPLDREAAVFIAAEVARALHYLHSAKDAAGSPLGLVHRDVSPENVLVSSSGDVKLIDLGSARARSGPQTRVGVARGKVAFMAPEQARAQRVDARTDVFALGCLLHFMLSGRSPIDHLDLTEIAAGVAPAIDPAIDPDLLEIIARATRADPKERWPTAEELALRLSDRPRLEELLPSGDPTAPEQAPLPRSPLALPNIGDMPALQPNTAVVMDTATELEPRPATETKLVDPTVPAIVRPQHRFEFTGVQLVVGAVVLVAGVSLLTIALVRSFHREVETTLEAHGAPATTSSIAAPVVTTRREEPIAPEPRSPEPEHRAVRSKKPKQKPVLRPSKDDDELVDRALERAGFTRADFASTNEWRAWRAAKKRGARREQELAALLDRIERSEPTRALIEKKLERIVRRLEERSGYASVEKEEERYLDLRRQLDAGSADLRALLRASSALEIEVSKL